MVETNLDKLSDEQFETISSVIDQENCKIEKVISVELTAGDTAITDLGGGTASVSIPLVIADGAKAENYRVYYIADDGSMTLMPSEYKDGALTFLTAHFSEYAVIASEKPLADYDSSTMKVLKVETKKDATKNADNADRVTGEENNSSKDTSKNEVKDSGENESAGQKANNDTGAKLSSGSNSILIILGVIAVIAIAAAVLILKRKKT